MNTEVWSFKLGKVGEKMWRESEQMELIIHNYLILLIPVPPFCSILLKKYNFNWTDFKFHYWFSNGENLIIIREEESDTVTVTDI